MKHLLAILVMALALGGCGGGSSDNTSTPAPAAPRLVGEIIATPTELQQSELVVNAGYSGNLATSRAIQAAGQHNLLDMLFMLNGEGTQGRNHNKVADDAETKLQAYVREQADLLTPGIRVLVLDEIYWNPPDERDTPEVLQPQLNALAAAVALVRKHIPQAKVGITVTPHAVIHRPQTLAYVKQAIALVDWVGTDPYWFGDPHTVQDLNDWSRSFHSLAKQANPAVETWFIAQAFKFPSWDTTTFNQFIEEQLRYAEQYDHLLFFGWQHTSELDSSTAGTHFPAATKQLYRKYLKHSPN